MISAASNLVFRTFFRNKTCCVVCHSYCFCYSATNMARTNVQNTTFDSTSEKHSRKMLSRDQIKKLASVKSVIPWEQIF